MKEEEPEGLYAGFIDDGPSRGDSVTTIAMTGAYGGRFRFD